MTTSHCLRAAILANSHMTYQPHPQAMGEELGRPHICRETLKDSCVRRGRLDSTPVTHLIDQVSM